MDEADPMLETPMPQVIPVPQSKYVVQSTCAIDACLALIFSSLCYFTAGFDPTRLTRVAWGLQSILLTEHKDGTDETQISSVLLCFLSGKDVDHIYCNTPHLCNTQFSPHLWHLFQAFLTHFSLAYLNCQSLQHEQGFASSTWPRKTY